MAVIKQHVRRKPAVHRGRPARSSRGRKKIAGSILLSFVACGLLVVLFIVAILVRHTVHLANSTRKNFDAIIVLGTPADSDGNPTPEQLDRVTEGVREYQRGVAPRLIMTGGAAHNNFVEADVMAHVAQAQGVPLTAILTEPRAQDTIQNACFSNRILQSHNWHSAEVVSSKAHLPRAAMIFSNLRSPGLQWRMHAASDALTPGYYGQAADLVETIKTARYLIWSRWVESCNE